MSQAARRNGGVLLLAVLGALAGSAASAQDVVCSDSPLADRGIAIPVRAIFKPDRLRYLHRTVRALLAGEALQAVAFGDSIVNDTFGPQTGPGGYHNSRAWGMQKIEERYGATIWTVVAVRGSTGAWWYREPGRVQTYVLDFDPDLVLIGGISHRDDIDAIRDVVQQIRAVRPATEIVLLTDAVNLVATPTESSLLLDTANGSFRARLALLADEVGAGFIDMRGSYDEYVLEASRSDPNIDFSTFQRDAIHANDMGRELLRQIVTMFFAPLVPCADRAPPRERLASPPLVERQLLMETAVAPETIANADFNGDGRGDLLLSSDAEAPTVQLGPIRERSVDPLARFTVGNLSLVGSAVVDLNRDGYPEVVGIDPIGRPQLFINAGAALPFLPTTAPIAIAAATAAGVIAPIDANQDGRLDLLVASAEQPAVTAHLNDGASVPDLGVPVASGITSNTRVQQMLAVDLDGDGREEILTLSEPDAQGVRAIHVHAAISPAGLIAGTTAFRVPVESASVTKLALRDLDGNGWPELLVGTDAGDPGIYVLRNTGRAGAWFVDALSLPKEHDDQCTLELRTVDLNRDSLPDIVTANGCNPNRDDVVSYYQNGGSWAEWRRRLPEHYDSGQQRLSSVAAADVDADGREELLAAGTGASGLPMVVALGLPATTAPDEGSGGSRGGGGLQLIQLTLLAGWALRRARRNQIDRPRSR